MDYVKISSEFEDWYDQYKEEEKEKSYYKLTIGYKKPICVDGIANFKSFGEAKSNLFTYIKNSLSTISKEKSLKEYPINNLIKFTKELKNLSEPEIDRQILVLRDSLLNDGIVKIEECNY